jgi:hypothetical protein
MYLTTLERDYYPRSVTPGLISSLGRRANESQYDVDQYDSLMKRTFGGGSRSYTPSTYYSSYYPYSRYSSYYDKPYYSDSYSYPYYYSSPYYSSYYSPSSYRDYYGTRDLGYYGSSYYPSRYTYGYAI